ncbi:TPA: retron St85 family effector protein [Haemophilus influenzae]
MQNLKKYFFELIDPNKTQIKYKLPFIWVFGSGAESIKRIEQIKDPLSPTHKNFRPYNEITSFRAGFIQWSKTISHDIVDNLTVPESYPQWLNFNKYSNLVDFELDIASISQGVIIFSESIGAHTEIGMFSNITELHKNILIIAPEKYIKDDNSSFFNYGAIRKIRENELSEELTNIWSLEDEFIHSYTPEQLNRLFKEISDHFLNIITDAGNPNTKLNCNNRHHRILLLLDLIDLFPSKTKSFYIDIIEGFGISLNTKEITNIITILDLLELISIKNSGNNKLYSIAIKDYVSCINYQANKPKRFERSSFKIEISGKKC